VDTHSPPKSPVSADGLQVGGGGGVGALTDGVLRIVDHIDGDPESVPERVHEGGDGAIAGAGDGLRRVPLTTSCAVMRVVSLPVSETSSCPRSS